MQRLGGRPRGSLTDKLWRTNLSFRVWLILWRTNSDGQICPSEYESYSEGKTLTENFCRYIQFLLLQILSFSWYISHELFLTANSMLKVLVITLFMHEKTRKMKKAFCFDNCSCYNLRKNVSSSDFSFSQVTKIEKREPRERFLKPQPTANGNLRKNKIIFLKIVARTIIETECFFHFSGFFVA